jgi:hypothetical protein
MGMIAAAAVQAIGGGISAAGNIQAGNTNQRLAEMEADSLDRRANLVILKGAEEAAMARRKGQQIQGAQKAGFAAGGIDVSTGTAARLFEETGAETEQDVRQLKLNAAREAWGLREQGKIRRWQGDVGKYQSRLQAIGGMFGTGGSIAGSMSS